VVGGEGSLRPEVDSHQVAVSGHDLLLVMDFIARVDGSTEEGRSTKASMCVCVCVVNAYIVGC
jgi:hypothetical protein